MRRRTAPLSALLAVLLALAAPGGAQETGSVAIEAVPAGIEELLGDHARAWQQADAELLAATMEPELASREREAFANASSVPFTELTLEATTRFSGDLASRRVRASYPDRRVATYHVIERSRIGPETDAYRQDGAFTFTHSEGRSAYDGWRLASKDDLADLGFFAPRHLWDGGEVAVRQGDRFVLLAHAEVVDEIGSVLEVAERAYDRVLDFWPRPVEDRYVIVVPSSTEELGAILQTTFDLTNFVAFVAAGVDREEGWEPTGPRMFIHLPNLRRYGDAVRTEIVAHELVHAVTRKLSGPNVPVWVEEGLANLGSGARPTRARTGEVPETFPTRDRFVGGPVGQIQVAYDRSQVALEVLADRAGSEGVAAFYEALGSARIVPGTESYHVREAVRSSVDWTYEEWLDAWRNRLR